MIATLKRSGAIARLVRTRRLNGLLLILLAPLLVVPTLLIAVSWWLTAPLGPMVRAAHRPVPVAAVPLPLALSPKSVEAPAPVDPPRVTLLTWPEGRLDGDAAKRLLREVLLAAEKKLESINGYTATFHKRERIAGKLGEKQTLELKLRQQPFAVYLKFVSPQPGKEVVYAEGRHDDMVIAHATGWSRRLVPRMAVPPTSHLALAENRHPITEAGLLSLARKLSRYREMDLHDAEAVTVLDQTQRCDGRTYFRSLHTHPTKTAGRPFARVEVLYDPETMLPVEISSFDWPEPGHTGELLLAEHYAYENLTLDASLTEIDFDPANPDYAFRRY